MIWGSQRPDCPSCAGPLVFCPGYRRYVREAGRYWKISVPRLRCARCGVSHAAGAAVPFITRRHVHRAVPQAARPDPHPTGAGYLGLVAAAHDGEAGTGAKIGFTPLGKLNAGEPGQEQEQEQER